MQFVLAHQNTDFDSLASQLAVTKLYPGTRMVPGYPLASNMRAFLALYRDSLPVADLAYVDADKIEHFFLVDCQRSERLDEFCRGLIDSRKVTYTVFDHHPYDEEGLGPTAREDSIIEPMGSCTTLLVGKLIDRKTALEPFEATLLLIGIYEDTGCLTYAGTKPLDAKCVAYLLEHGADLAQVNNFINPKLSDEQKELFQTLSDNVETFTVSGAHVLLTHASDNRYIEGVATLTRHLMEVHSADVAVSVVFMRDRVHIVCRSDDRAINVRDLARTFGGDGHPGAASAVSKEPVGKLVKEVRHWLKTNAREETTAGEIMVAPVRTIVDDVSMEEAGRIMLRYGHEGLIVTKGDEILGVVARRDVDKANHHHLGHAPVRGFMSRPVISIREDTPLSEVQALMIKHDIGRLPVLGAGGELLGIVSRKEVLRTLYGQQAAGRQNVPTIGEGVNKLRLKERLNTLDAPTRWLFEQIGVVAESLGMTAYAVGGVVRDLFLDRRNFDLDFVIEGSAIALGKALETSYPGRFEVIAKHDRFQTTTVRFNCGEKRDVDLSTARIEFYEQPAALPTVEPSVLEQDLFRRDFTINALAICVNPDRFGEVIDFFDGVGDIDAELIRVLHRFSFVEDPTRIIRAVRFAARLNFEIEEETVEQARDAIRMGIFDELGGFRLKEELRLILQSQQRLRAFQMLSDLGGGLRYLAKGLVFDGSVRRKIRRAERLLEHNPVAPDWVVYLGVLLSPLEPSAVEAVLERLQLANDEREWIRSGLKLASDHATRNGNANAVTRSQIYSQMEGHSDQALAIAAAVASPGAPVRRWIRLYLDELRYIKPEISGTDLIEMGFGQGPQIKEALQRVHQARLDGLVSSASQELDYVRSLFLKL